MLKTSVAAPGSGAFLTPGSGMGKDSGSGSGMNNPDHISIFRDLRNNFLGLKYLNSLMRIRDGKNSDLVYGMEKIRIRNKRSGSATLVEDPRSCAVLSPGSEIRDLE